MRLGLAQSIHFTPPEYHRLASLGQPRSLSLSASHVCSPHNHHIHTPIHTNHLIYLLRLHADPHFQDYIAYGYTFGFNSGHSCHTHPRHSLNLPSAACRPDVITEYLQGECNSGNTVGPFQTSPFPSLVTSPLGVIPKKDGKWHLIMHLSFPDGHSINDGINIGDFPLKYVTVYDAVDMITSIGRGALMAKLDIKNAFRLCPVRPADQHLLGIALAGLLLL